MFDPNSRYVNLSNKVLELPNGKTITYKTRRLLPPLADLTKIGEIQPQDGERIDQMATRALGDPLRFWQLCDGNDSLDPAELEQLGRAVNVTVGAVGGDSLS